MFKTLAATVALIGTVSFALPTWSQTAAAPDDLRDAKTAALSGTIGSNVDLSVANQEVIFQGKHGLRVHVHNRTDQPLVFNGDLATVHLGADVLKAAGGQAVIGSVCPPVSLAANFVHGLIDFATVGFYDTARDAESQAGPVLGRYGCDEARREAEFSRFGTRILWPGDDTDGIVYFVTDKTLNGGTVDIPVAVYHPETNGSAAAPGSPAKAEPQAPAASTTAPPGNDLSVPLRPALPPAASPPPLTPGMSQPTNPSL